VPPASVACGFVLSRLSAGPREYLILVNRRRGEAGLPKGHREGEETEVETALRETEEESGLTDLDVDPHFRRRLHYPARRGGVLHDKTVVYLLATARRGEVRLSDEHSSFRWAPLADALAALPFENLRAVVRDAAIFLKDPALFLLEPADEPAADAHLRSLPHADERLLAHLRGGARLARRFAAALVDAGTPVHVEAAAVGTLLHDAGRALGEHADHQRAGVRHLRTTPLAAYAFACISHFTKGAPDADLLAAGVPEETVRDFRRLVDGSTLTWEERCAALADSCMMGPTPAPPAERFRDLRRRYDAPALIDLQERRTAAIRAEMEPALGRDPLALVGLHGRDGA
jgi:8-oxo-dGTP pyrophosphatase MutT (NUDIX family)